MSASSSLALTVLQNPLSQPLLQKPPVLHIIFYNPSIKKAQVQTAALYERWITGKLKADVTAAILKHNADIIALVELGEIEDGLGPTLNVWKNLTVLKSLAITTWWKICYLNS